MYFCIPLMVYTKVSMRNYITNIHINKLFHLNDFDIPIEDAHSPHLILTGKNGSGKTVFLNALADFLDKVKNDSRLSFLKYREWTDNAENRLNTTENGTQEHAAAETQYVENKQRWESLYGKVSIDFGGNYDFISKYAKGEFIIAFYEAARKTAILEPKNPTKPTLSISGGARNTLASQFLNFLSDLKIQEALARNEQQTEEAEEIKKWFDDLENILRQIYEDDKLHISFNYKHYSFNIETQGKSFKFTELSDGFIAIIEIVADLIMKMQDGDNLVRSYQKEGIVLIDEIETHLHLSLQKNILPLLTRIFPNIQFIVTTHSPFVLNSLPNATAFDLEHREPISDLTGYSYQALTESYFGVSTDSNYTQSRLDELRAMLEKDVLSRSEKAIACQIIEDFKKIPEAMSPALTGEYKKLFINSFDKIQNLTK